MKKINLLVACIMMLTVLGCNSIKGIGEDISAIGGWMVRGSEKAQEPKAE